MRSTPKHKERAKVKEPCLYVQDPKKLYPRVHLEEGEYAQAILRFPVVCTDIGIVDCENMCLYLARRKARPARHWWWFIGGGTYVGESGIQSAHRCFARETGLLIAKSRFSFVCFNRYLFSDRQQFPHEYGCDSLCYTYILNLSKEELDRVKLDPDEYEGGLMPYHLKDIRTWKSGMNKDIMSDFWNRVFRR